MAPLCIRYPQSAQVGWDTPESDPPTIAQEA